MAYLAARLTVMLFFVVGCVSTGVVNDDVSVELTFGEQLLGTEFIRSWTQRHWKLAKDPLILLPSAL